MVVLETFFFGSDNSNVFLPILLFYLSIVVENNKDMDISSGLYVLFIVVYYGIVAFVLLRILLENKNPLKTQSYLLLALLLPVIGLVIYFLFGVNFRKRKLFSRKAFIDQKIIKDWIDDYQQLLMEPDGLIHDLLSDRSVLAHLFWKNNYSSFSKNNTVTVLNNGEEKFPLLLQKLENARHHIHMEYYKFDEDNIGSRVIDMLCIKSEEGVEVRLIIDAIGSDLLSTASIKRMEEAGVKIYFYNKVFFKYLSNRVNYRDHRKIVVIDGSSAFFGGINISDKYINDVNSKIYWRDTHCMIEGEAVYFLQVLFLLNWYFLSKELIKPDDVYFPEIKGIKGVVTSIISSDPDSDSPNLMEAYFSMITSSKREILIITPYFIPNESILTALKTSAKGGVRIVLLLPEKSDSIFINAASMTFVGELLQNNIEVYLYHKGMIHSKVMIVDEMLSTIGTANMDYRSFDHNAEVNGVFYDENVAAELKSCFMNDLGNARRLNYKEWKKRPFWFKLIGSVARLIAPLL